MKIHPRIGYTGMKLINIHTGNGVVCTIGQFDKLREKYPITWVMDSQDYKYYFTEKHIKEYFENGTYVRV